jgi:hypothetical protein
MRKLVPDELPFWLVELDELPFWLVELNELQPASQKASDRASKSRR